jgi:non-ribosomal peptide synthetase component E (peptide arylation enzyme)
MPQGGIVNPISDQLRRSSEFRAAGHWGDDTLVTLIDRWADADPGHPYLSDGVGELTYGEFRAQAWNLAAAPAERGVKGPVLGSVRLSAK